MASKKDDLSDTGPSGAPGTTAPWGAAMPTHNIWLAGLGALAQAQADAQAEGRKAFESLVSQGLEMQAQSQEIAARQWSEAAERLGAMTTQVAANAPGWNRLSGIFETRVQRALANLGLPTAEDWAQLQARVDALEKALAAQKKKTAASVKASRKRTPAAKKDKS